MTDIQAGQKFRIVQDTWNHKFPVGTVVTVVRAYPKANDFLGTTDASVDYWLDDVCKYVGVDDVEPVSERDEDVARLTAAAKEARRKADLLDEFVKNFVRNEAIRTELEVIL